MLHLIVSKFKDGRGFLRNSVIAPGFRSTDVSTYARLNSSHLPSPFG